MKFVSPRRMRNVALALAVAVAVAACGGGSGDDDSTPIDGAAGDAAVSLETPANTWTWVEIPGTMCANGTPSGRYILAGFFTCWD